MKYILPAGTKVDLYFKDIKTESYTEISTITEFNIIIDTNLIRYKPKLKNTRIDKIMYDEFVMWFDGADVIKMRD